MLHPAMIPFVVKSSVILYMQGPRLLANIRFFFLLSRINIRTKIRIIAAFKNHTIRYHMPPSHVLSFACYCVYKQATHTSPCPYTHLCSPKNERFFLSFFFLPTTNHFSLFCVRQSSWKKFSMQDVPVHTHVRTYVRTPAMCYAGLGTTRPTHTYEAKRRMFILPSRPTLKSQLIACRQQRDY